MSSEWPSRSLGEFVRLQRGHDLTAAEQREGGIPVMGSAGPNGTHSEALAKGPGVVIGRSGGSIGRVHFSEVAFWPHNTCLYVTDFLGNNPRFAYYLLQTLNLAGYNSGSAQPSLNRNFIYAIRIQVPARREQDEVAHLLHSFDERIALLRETNATLEAIAQALFKSWFVDFDPVRAKSQGLTPVGMEEAIAAHFPSAFDATTATSCPVGWRAGRVEDLLELAYGKALKATDRVAGDVPVYGSGGLTGYHNEPLISGPSVIVGRKGTIGSLNWEDRPSFPIDTVFYLRPKVPLTFCFYQLQVLGLSQMNTDGAVPGLNRNNVYRLPVVIPTPAVLGAFDEVVGALRRRVFANERQAQNLAGLRDTLLPRLISGRLSHVTVEADLAA